MTQEQIEGNIALSEFLSPSIEWNDSKKGKIKLYYTAVHDATCCGYRELKYHSDWRELMPVWYKFRELPFIDGKHKYFFPEITNAILYLDIESAFTELVAAVKWYNQNKEA